MRHRSSILLSILALALASPAHAGWKAGGVRLPITPFDDWMTLLPDGQGGAYFLFVPTGPPRQIRAQHVLADGSLDPLDGPSGQLVAPVPSGVGSANAIADGATGVVLTFQRCAFPQPHTPCYETGENRLSRWRAGGAIAGWPDSGDVVGPCWPNLTALSLASGGDGGAVVLIGDALKRWTGSASKPWTPDPGQLGVRVSTSPRAHRNVAIAPDGSGGAWAVWDEDAAFNPQIDDIRINRVSSGGLRLRGANGALYAQQADLTARTILPDGAGGAYFAWSVISVQPGGSADEVFVQHVDADGNVLWEPEGVPLGPIPYLALLPAGEDDLVLLVLDGAGRQRVQKLSGGLPAWPGFAGGVAVGVPGVNPVSLVLKPGANGSLFVTWSDSRSGSLDPYVTLLDAAGQPAPGWTLAGTALANQPSDEYAGFIVPGANAGEAIVSWWRPSTLVSLYDLVLQKVTTQGVLSVPPAPPALALSPAWPNPSRDGWTVRFSQPTAGRADLELFDVAGRRIWSRQVEAGSAGAAQVRIESRGLAEGVYRLRLRTAAGERSRPLVLMR